MASSVPAPPAAGAIVMGSGIVSLALSRDGFETLSRVVLAFAVAAWLILGLSLAAGWQVNRAGVRAHARSPAALSGVAGTAVLGSRAAVLGWSGAAVALLIVAAAGWLVLVPPVLRHLARPTVGASLMLTVATEGIAGLAASTAATMRAPWLLVVAGSLVVLGLVLYVVVLRRFAFREIYDGCGDHWITGGALAICTLAVAQVASASTVLGAARDVSSALRTGAVVVWIASVCWLPALLAGEVARPRLRYDLRRWSTVFPLGMYAACSFAVGVTSHAAAFMRFARVWVWVAFAVWLVVGAGTLRRLEAVAGESVA